MKWSPGLNLLTGKNGSGKTNILEGINIISGWGPLERGTRSVSLPTWGSGSTEVQLTGQLNNDGEEIIRVKIAGRSTIKIDDKLINATELRWRIPVLTFLPNDMAILEGSASCRRRLLDMVLALIVPPYAVRLNNYRHGIRQKSVLLRKYLPTVTVDKALQPLAIWIWKMREEGVNLLSHCLEGLEDLLPSPVTLSLKRGGGGTTQMVETDYLESLLENRDRERMMKIPLTGPHRDDLIVECGNQPAVSALSRGLRRRTAIALILAASESVRRKQGKDPVLLLDEVTAELDAEGRKLLFDALLTRRTQVFAATAEPFTEGFPGAVYMTKNGHSELL